MKYRIEDRELQKMDDDARYVSRRFSKAVHTGFRKAMFHIKAVANAADLHAFRGLRFERLKGDRTGQHSMRLNDQFRLIVRMEKATNDQEIVVIEIVDYH